MLKQLRACCAVPRTVSVNEVNHEPASRTQNASEKAGPAAISIKASAACILPGVAVVSVAPPPELPASTHASYTEPSPTRQSSSMAGGPVPLPAQQDGIDAVEVAPKPKSLGSGSGSPRWLTGLASKLPHPPSNSSKSQGTSTSGSTTSACEPTPAPVPAPAASELKPLSPEEVEATELVASALAALATPQPEDPISLLETLRSACMHHPHLLLQPPRPASLRPTASSTSSAQAGSTTAPAAVAQQRSPTRMQSSGASQQGHLPPVVAAAQKCVRSPRLGVARTALMLIIDLYQSFGDSMFRLTDDDSSSTSSLTLQLLTKAAGADLQSKALLVDVDAALSAISRCLTPEHVQDIFQPYTTHKNKKVAEKAAAALLGLAPA